MKALHKKNIYCHLLCCICLLGCHNNSGVDFAENTKIAERQEDHFDTANSNYDNTIAIEEIKKIAPYKENRINNDDNYYTPNNQTDNFFEMKEENNVQEKEIENVYKPAILPAVPQRQKNSAALTAIKAEFMNYRLFKASTYNSGYGNADGSSSKSYYDLCANGNFTFNSVSEVVMENAYGNTTNKQVGTWRVEEVNTQYILWFKDSDGAVWNYQVEINEEHQIFLNQQRWYHIPKGDPYGNGPTSCN
jgi:hypothetical protein